MLSNTGDPGVDPPGDWGTGFTAAWSNNSGAVKSVDVGNIDEKDDDASATLDIAIATGTTVYYYQNDGSWTRNTVDTMTNAIEDLEVGDVNGDMYDDIVFIYLAPDESGAIDEVLFYYQNDGSAGTWTDHVIYVKDFGTLKNYEWYAVDIGDVDRGIVQ